MYYILCIIAQADEEAATQAQVAATDHARVAAAAASSQEMKLNLVLETLSAMQQQLDTITPSTDVVAATGIQIPSHTYFVVLELFWTILH